MTNRIDGMGSGSIGASNGGGPIEQVRPSAAAGTATNAPQPGVDNVNITDSARRMLALAQAVQAAPEVNTQRVAELQQSNLERLDDSISDITSALSQERSERVERQKEMVARQDEMAERQKYLDDRIDRLVSAIGELARRQ